MTDELKTVYVAVYDGWADWEVGHATAHLNAPQWQHRPGRFRVRAVGLDAGPVTTAGGLRIVPDGTVGDIRPSETALLVLPGAPGWDTDPDAFTPWTTTARALLDAGVPVAAICGATAGLARAGLLDGRAHTSAAAGYLAATGYPGGGHYREALAVTDGDVITAGPTAPVAFAREIFARLDLYPPPVLDAWHRLFAHSDPGAYPVLMAAGS